MSRIGKKPIAASDRSGCESGGNGCVGERAARQTRLDFEPGIGVTVDKGQVVVTRSSEDRKVRAMHWSGSRRTQQHDSRRDQRL